MKKNTHLGKKKKKKPSEATSTFTSDLDKKR